MYDGIKACLLPRKSGANVQAGFSAKRRRFCAHGPRGRGMGNGTQNGHVLA